MYIGADSDGNPLGFIQLFAEKIIINRDINKYLNIISAVWLLFILKMNYGYISILYSRKAYSSYVPNIYP